MLGTPTHLTRIGALRPREVATLAAAFLAVVAVGLVLVEALGLLGVRSRAATGVGAVVVCFPLCLRLASRPVLALGEGRGHVGWVYVGNVAASEHPQGTPGAAALLTAVLSGPEVAARWTFLDALAPDPADQQRLVRFYAKLGYEVDQEAAPKRGRRASTARMQRPPGSPPAAAVAAGGWSRCSGFAVRT